jgi:hypothetical protein
VIAFIGDEQEIKKILKHLDLWMQSVNLSLGLMLRLLTDSNKKLCKIQYHKKVCVSKKVVVGYIWWIDLKL